MEGGDTVTDPRLLADGEFRVLLVGLPKHTSAAILADRAARIAQQAADEAMLRECLSAWDALYILGPDVHSNIDARRARLTAAIARLRARLSATQPKETT